MVDIEGEIVIPLPFVWMTVGGSGDRAIELQVCLGHRSMSKEINKSGFYIG
jgi:hypothetical protein